MNFNHEQQSPTSAPMIIYQLRYQERKEWHKHEQTQHKNDEFFTMALSENGFMKFIKTSKN